MACPGLIAMAIHYYTTPGPYAPHEPEHATSPAANDWHHILLDARLLRHSDSNGQDIGRTVGPYVATEAMAIYIKALERVQFPVQRWVIPGDKQ